MGSRLPRARQNDLIIQELPEEVLVYDCNVKKAFCLNKTAATIWKYCDGKTDVNQIARLAGQDLNGTINEDLVWLSLTELGNQNLLNAEVSLPGSMSGMNRREMIRRAAIASAVALPIITSIAAPKAAQAQSPGGQVCSNVAGAFTTQPNANCPTGCQGQVCAQGSGTCSTSGNPPTCQTTVIGPRNGS